MLNLIPRRGLFRCLRLRGGLVAVFLLTVWPQLLWAQEPGALPKEDKGIVQWVVAVGLILLICASAFLNPKRSHLG